MLYEQFGSRSREASNKNGIRRLKSGSIPAKADTSVQRGDYDTRLRPLMIKATQNHVTLLFLDASPFVMDGDFLGYLTRRFIKTFSRHTRYQVLSVLKVVTKKVTTVANNTYITVAEVCEMLRKAAGEYAGKTVHSVLDNARYQKCGMVTHLAEERGIALHYIPPYSPNLNR